MIMRGGSSKGAYFVRSDLPVVESDRDDLLLKIIGSPDPRQIDGIGGAHPLTSKVAVVAPSPRDDSDVEYLFLQVGVEDAMVTDRQNCGNLLAGVAPFAIERGLVTVADTATEATIRVYMCNTDSVATATLSVAHGAPVYDGATSVSGVPGTAEPIRLDFDDIAGGSTGALLPTGNVVDIVRGVECTLIDNGMPVVVMAAEAMGITGSEDCATLEANADLRARLEDIRLEAGLLMNLGDVAEMTVPKLTMVSRPAGTGAINTRTFIPHRCHDAIGVLGAVSVATAALLPGTPANRVLVGGTSGSVIIEHPTGYFEAAVAVALAPDGTPVVGSAGIVRTARKLMDGIVFPRAY